MKEEQMQQTIEQVRHFNRFYTRRIGVVSGHYLDTPYTLTEARIFYELAAGRQLTVTQLASELSLDAGYVSRLLSGLRKKGLVEMQPGETDGRQRILRLSEGGAAAFEELNMRSQQDMERLLLHLNVSERGRLAACMQTIEELLDARPEDARSLFLLRRHRPADMSWVVHRQMLLYAQEYGWNGEFEVLAGEICARFIKEFDANYENSWLAERDGNIIGSVFVAKKSETTAQLRMLYVEPAARGLGLGTRLVDECIRFARQVGYQEMVLWTHSILGAARHIYEHAGFHIVSEEASHIFGKDLISETWQMTL